METKEPKRKSPQPVELDENLLASVSGGTADTEAEVERAMEEETEEDLQEVTPVVGAIM